MPCPICASKKTGYFAKKGNYLFNRCGWCKTIFLLIKPSQKQQNEYYSKQFSYRDGFSNETVIRKRSHIILRKIKCLAPQAKTICDVGSGYGFFLDEAQTKGYKTVGIEPSEQLANYAIRRYGIPTVVEELQEYKNVEKKQFDVVTCIHVIEHVSNPKEFISLLIKLVKPGGILYIETPNSDSHLLYAENKNYTFLIPPEHLWILSQDSFRYLLPGNSQIIGINTYSYSEHLMGIVKQTVKNLRHFERSEKSRPTGRNKHAEFTLSNAEGLDFSTIPLNDNVYTKMNNIRKKLFYFLFDRGLAPLFTSLLNLYHKGSILELYIRKN